MQLMSSQVDSVKLAEACGMTNPRSASNAWANIKKKILAHAGISTENGDGTGSPTKKTPKATPRKRKKAAAEGEGGGDEETPAKKVKPTPKKKGAAKSEAIVEDGEGDSAVGEEGKAKEEAAGD
jgi:hypothetical protein